MTIEHFRLSQQARDQLLNLKRRTGLSNWNVLCRLGFCMSLSEASMPPNAEIPADSNVELTWRVFGGEYADVYMALLRDRCALDGADPDSDDLGRQFRLHLHRGIGYLAGDRNIRNITDLTRKLIEVWRSGNPTTQNSAGPQ